MREVGERHALGNTALEQVVDPRAAARREGLAIGARAQLVRQARREEHEFGRLVACVVGTVTEVHPRAAQCALAAVDGCADGFSGCVG